ncbi:DUF3267 domain-containing protein [Fodinibius halophilus]|uniref:DUF3267 domain-containing protein n=1 Tax=Fodinibius halophilus TaxID=1736908 RepID=A0A6M1T5L9_9BACT|nr:DUF3267 domain-containing protein [Fodinibius halophilus]NGP87281.1 DUF3267 domain-containing protein [Fodinibius halophilus]
MPEEYTLSFQQANWYGLALFIPLTSILVLPYAGMYGWSTLVKDLVFFLHDFPLFLVSVVIGTIAHELIHAICWVLLGNIPWSHIHFGFNWKALAPYVHCPDPVEVSSYRWGVAMPGIILGLIPYLYALLFHQEWLLGFSLFFTLAAGGDMLILWLLRRVKRGNRVQDHPDLVGCRLIDSDTMTGTGDGGS